MNTEQTQMADRVKIEASDPVPKLENDTTHHPSDETQSSPSSSEAQQCDKNENDDGKGLLSSSGATSSLEGVSNSTAQLDVAKDIGAELGEDNGRERLKRHRVEVAGRVWIPEIWGQEEFLKDWADCSAFDASLVPSGIKSARAALVREGRRASPGWFSIENRC
ncbi:hypothetical protein SLE2022_079390 [Rubroshorea leprosula]